MFRKLPRAALTSLHVIYPAEVLPGQSPFASLIAVQNDNRESLDNIPITGLKGFRLFE
jgi:hypothetical protein